LLLFVESKIVRIAKKPLGDEILEDEDRITSFRRKAIRNSIIGGRKLLNLVWKRERQRGWYNPA
jgi:hypothetical protein